MSQLSQTAANAEAGVAWLYHVIDISELRSLIRIGESLGILLLFLCKEGLHVAAFFLHFLGFFTAKHGNSATGTHHGNLA